MRLFGDAAKARAEVLETGAPGMNPSVLPAEILQKMLCHVVCWEPDRKWLGTAGEAMGERILSLAMPVFDN